MASETSIFGDGFEDGGSGLPTTNEVSQRPSRKAPSPDKEKTPLDGEGIVYGEATGSCGRRYGTLENERMCGEPGVITACCMKNLPTVAEWETYRKLMEKMCKQEALTVCEKGTLRELRYKFGIAVWGFSPIGFSYEAARILNRSQLKDFSVYFGKEAMGTFLFLMCFVWSVAGFASNSPASVTITDSTNVGLEDAINALVSYQYTRDLRASHYWNYVFGIFASTFITHLLFVTSYIEGTVAFVMWMFSDNGLFTANKPRFGELLWTLLGQMAGAAIFGGITLAVWGYKDDAFDTLRFEPSLLYSEAAAWMFENTGCFIIGLGWIATIVVPRSLIKQFYAFQVVVPPLITTFHAVAKSITLNTTGGALGIWTYLTISLFLTGFGKGAWLYFVAPLTGTVLMASIIWWLFTRYIYSFGGNMLGKIAVRALF